MIQNAYSNSNQIFPEQIKTYAFFREPCSERSFKHNILMPYHAWEN